MKSSKNSSTEGGRFLSFLTAAAAFFSSCIISQDKYTDSEKNLKGSWFRGKFGKASKQDKHENASHPKGGARKEKLGWFYNKLVPRFKGQKVKNDDLTKPDDVFINSEPTPVPVVEISNVPSIESLSTMLDTPTLLSVASLPCMPDVSSVPPVTSASLPCMVDLSNVPSFESLPAMIEVANVPSVESLAQVADSTNVPDVDFPTGYSTQTVKVDNDFGDVDSMNDECHDDMIVPDNSKSEPDVTTIVVFDRDLWEKMTGESSSSTSVKTGSDTPDVAEDINRNSAPDKPPIKVCHWNDWEENASGNDNPTAVQYLSETDSISDGNTSAEQPAMHISHGSDWEENESGKSSPINSTTLSEAASISGSATSLLSACSAMSEEDISAITYSTSNSINSLPQEATVSDEMRALTSMAQEFDVLLARAENISRLSTRSTPRGDPLQQGVHNDVICKTLGGYNTSDNVVWVREALKPVNRSVSLQEEADAFPPEENENIVQIRKLQGEVNELIKDLMPEMNFFI